MSIYRRASLRNGSLSGQLQTPQQSKTANTDSRASSTNSSRSARGSISTGATPRALTIPCEFTFKTAERASVRNLSTAHGDGEELSDSLMRSFGPNSTSSSSFSTPKGRRPSTASSCSSSSSGRRSSVTPRALTVPVPFSFETEVRSAQKRELHAPLLTSEELAMQNIQPFKALPMNKHILDGVAGDIGVPRLRKTSLTQPMSPKLQTASRAQERRARESTAAEDLDDGGRRFSRFDTDAVTPRRSTRNSLGRRDSSASSSNSSSSSSSSSVLGRRRSSVAFDSDDSSSEAPAKRQRTSLSLTMPVSPKLATKRRASIRAARLSSAFGTQLDAAAADPDTETPSRFRSFDGSDRGRDSIASTAAAEPYVDSTPARSFESSLRSAPRTSISTQRPNKLGLTQPRPFNLQTESRQVLRAAQANIERRSERTREALRNLPSTRPAPASASKPEARATTSKTVAKAAVIPARVQPTRACAPRASTSTATNSLLSTATTTTTTTHRALVPTAKANMPIASSTTTRRAPSRVSKPTEPAAAAATEGAKQTVKATPAAKPERVLADISNTRQTSTAAAKKPTPALALASASTANIKVCSPRVTFAAVIPGAVTDAVCVIGRSEPRSGAYADPADQEGRRLERHECRRGGHHVCCRRPTLAYGVAACFSCMIVIV